MSPNVILISSSGTLVQGYVLDKNCSVGLILGTGSNACYIERAERVFHWEAERHDEKEVKQLASSFAFLWRYMIPVIRSLWIINVSLYIS